MVLYPGQANVGHFNGVIYRMGYIYINVKLTLREDYLSLIATRTVELPAPLKLAGTLRGPYFSSLQGCEVVTGIPFNLHGYK